MQDQYKTFTNNINTTLLSFVQPVQISSFCCCCWIDTNRILQRKVVYVLKWKDVPIMHPVTLV